MHNLIRNLTLEYGGAAVAAASNTDDNSTRFDMQGYDGIMAFTTITDCANTGVATLKLEENSADSDTGMTAITGASAAATSAGDDDLNGKTLIVDWANPTQRYVQAVRVSATANIAFGEVYVVRYRGRKVPVTPSTNATLTVGVG